MSAPRSLNIRKLDRNARPTRSGQDRKPNFDDEGEAGVERGVDSERTQDSRFQDRMMKALLARKEKLPQVPKPAPPSVPRVIRAVTYMPTASVADTLG